MVCYYGSGSCTNATSAATPANSTSGYAYMKALPPIPMGNITTDNSTCEGWTSSWIVSTLTTSKSLLSQISLKDLQYDMKINEKPEWGFFNII